MTTRDRVTKLAVDLGVLLGVSVYAEPGSPGRSGQYVYVEAPTFLFESAGLSFCIGGRAPRLDTSVVIVGAGTAPGQLVALYDAVDDLIVALDEVEGWSPSGDATPGDYQGAPAYVVPVRTY